MGAYRISRKGRNLRNRGVDLEKGGIIPLTNYGIEHWKSLIMWNLLTHWSYKTMWYYVLIIVIAYVLDEIAQKSFKKNCRSIEKPVTHLMYFLKGNQLFKRMIESQLSYCHLSWMFCLRKANIYIHKFTKALYG